MRRKIICGCSGNYPERRWTQFLILRVVYEKPLYGYKIVEHIKKLTRGRYEIKYGTIYTLLHRMEKDGLLTSQWEKIKGTPDKRIYKVTPEGKKYLKIWLEMVIEKRRMMDKMVGFYKKYFKQ